MNPERVNIGVAVLVVAGLLVVGALIGWGHGYQRGARDLAAKDAALDAALTRIDRARVLASGWVEARGGRIPDQTTRRCGAAVLAELDTDDTGRDTPWGL